MITKSTGNTYRSRPVLKTIACSTTPSPMAAAAMRGKLSMRPSTTAASARTSTVTPSALPIGKSATPARRKTVMKASTVVITHTVAWIRPTGMPSVEARSDALGRGPDRDADPRVAHEQRERDQHDRDDEEDHQVVVVEEDAADVHLDVERRVERRPVEVLEPEPARHEQREGGEQLREADRGDREDEARRAGEPVDDRPLDDEAEEDRADQAEQEGDRVGEAGHPVGRAARGILGEQEDREDRGHRAEIALREVDDAVGAVDERESDREQRGERTDERALHDDAERRIPEHVGDVDEDDRRYREREHRDAGRRVAIEVDERDGGDQAEQLFLAITRFGQPERERRPDADRERNHGQRCRPFPPCDNRGHLISLPLSSPRVLGCVREPR